MLKSYFTPNSSSSKFDLFNHLNKSLKILKREGRSFIDLIDKEKSQIYNMFEKDAYFKGILPRIFHYSKGLKLSKSFSKRSIRNINYLKSITDKINDNNISKNDIIKLESQSVSNQNNLGGAELMKRKTKLFENKLKLYQNPIIKKNNSFILKPFKIKSYFEKSEEKNNSDNQSLNLKILKLKIKPFKLNKINFKSYTNVPKEKKIKKLNILLNKCQSGINEGHNIEKEFEKLYFKDYEEKEKINKEKNQLNMLDILNEQKNRKVEKINFNEKYKAIEEAKFKELKKEIRLKVSESFAFSNRKEYLKKINNPRPSQPYEFYLEELNSINKKNKEKRKIENKNISKIKNLLEDFHVEKELLKKKINRYNDKHKEQRKLSEENKNNSKKGKKISRDIDEYKKMRNYFNKRLKNMTSINNSII